MADKKVEHELSFHIEMLVRDLIEQGETPERARELALRRFGDYDESRKLCLAIDERRERGMARAQYLTEFRQDAAYALRMLRRTPAFTAVAVLTLALGIGATSAIFSVVHGVLLSSLPYRDPDRLVRIRTLYPDGTPYSVSAPDFLSLRADTRVFEAIEAYSLGASTLTGRGEPREIAAASITGGLFDLLGLPMAAGRGIQPADTAPERSNVVVLDHGFWMREFGGEQAVVSRSISIDGVPMTVVGVLGPDVRIPAAADLYRPLEIDPAISATSATARRSEFLATIGRAKPGIAAAQLEADLNRVGRELEKTFPQTNGTLTFTGIALRDLVVGDVRTPLFMLFGAVGFVLLVACANVANLLLARASVRQREFAVREALGAGRGRLLRQLLTESTMLGLAGGLIGLVIAYWGTSALVAARPPGIPRLDSIGLNLTVVLFTLSVALATGLVFGTLPAIQATRRRLLTSLRESGRGGGAGASGHRARATLVVAEIALAVVLLTGAGLLIRSFIEMTRVDPGFDAAHAAAFRVVLQGDTYPDRPQIAARVAEFEERLRGISGITAVAATTVLPLSGRGSMLDFMVEGAPAPPPNVNPEIAVASVTPDYFRAIGAPIRQGRMFSNRDHAEAPLVAVVNEAAVRRWFSDRSPIGARVRVGGASREIVGVVADVLQRDPAQPAVANLFAPFAQRPGRTVRIVLRTAGDPLTVAPAVRAAVRGLDANLAITGFAPLDELVTLSMARPRFYTALLTLFAGVALILAAAGIFGVMSYAVAQRTREISIRMALGARAADVLRMIVGRAVALAAVGLAIGVAVALALGRAIQGQLFGVTLFDPVTLAGVVVALGATATIASLIPARRAAGLDPGRGLREG